jgi:hypothetical protein
VKRKAWQKPSLMQLDIVDTLSNPISAAAECRNQGNPQAAIPGDRPCSS